MKKGQKLEATPPLALKIVDYDISQLNEMLPISRYGRFFDIRTDIKRKVATMKPGKFFVIPVTGALTDERERQSFEGSIKNMFSKYQLAWTIKYSQVNNSYLVVRREDFNKARNPNV